MNTGEMANWSLLKEFLNGVDDRVTLTWPELDEIVGGMPLTATKFPAWWGSGHSHFDAWTSAGFSYTDLTRGSCVTFYRIGAGKSNQTQRQKESSRQHSLTRGQLSRGPNQQNELPRADLLLMSCVSTKLQVPAMAKDLYSSDLFHKERAYAERSGATWYILSGEHRLVKPEEKLAPYDSYLPKKSADYRRSWGTQVVASLEELEGPLQGKVIEIHAAIPYIAAIRAGLESRGAIVTEAWRGRGGIGKILQWYSRVLA